MTPVRLTDETRCPGKPKDWDEETMGICEALSIHDHEDEHGHNWMISAWRPDADELKRLNAGHFLYLKINGLQHPVVSLLVPEQGE